MNMSLLVSRGASALVGCVVAAGLVLVPAAPASADVHPADPSDPTTPKTAAAKGLPTPQINGVVWDQEVVGNTVYVAGEFSSARPAGAAAGTNETPRGNLLAYDIRTGVMSTTWAPSVNAEVNDIEASPDGSRLYIAGNFTTVNGAAQQRIAALDPTNGALITSFNPNPNGHVYAVAPTNTTVYFGGVFGVVKGLTRPRFAAAQASNGAVLDWAPSADAGYPWAMKLSPDGTQVLAGGSFTSVNGSNDPGLGMASIDAVTGALRPWEANHLIRNDGSQVSAITSIETDGQYAYVSGATFSRLSNLEGIAKMDWNGGKVIWVEDCHGDTLDTHPDGGVIYSASHAHYCGNLPDGFAQSDPWDPRRATAFTTRTTGTLRPEYNGYFNWAGTPAPSNLPWYPPISSGTYTGQGQGAWDVDGNADYIVYGGEFPKAGGLTSQGLIRFAKNPTSAQSQPPSDTPALLTPKVRSNGAGQVEISWRASWDQDNENLTYEVVRDENFASPINTRVLSSDEWDRPYQAYLDTGVTPGSTVTYRVVVKDPDGHQIRSNPVTVTVASSGSMDDYAKSVMADGPQDFWRFNEASGATVGDYTGRDDATVSGTPTRNVAGAVAGDAAITLNGTSAQRAYSTTAGFAPFWYTVEAWFKTSSNRGGKIVGFGTSQSGTSSSSQNDHTLYMDNSGRIYFGSRMGSNLTVNSGTGLNNNQWHQAVGVQTNSGMSLYIDGVRVGNRSDVRVGMARNGWWRIGGDNLSGWTNRPSSDYFSGSIDEVAVYHQGLSADRVRAHYLASGRSLSGTPTDAYGTAVTKDGASTFWRLAETSGTTASDSSLSGSTGSYDNGPVQGGASAVGVAADKSTGFDGVNDGVSGNTAQGSPDRYSTEAWFKTTTGAGGKILGFGSSKTGASSTTDRNVYMTNNGRLRFGTTTATGTQAVVETGQSYNNGQWHHVVATQGRLGMRLYVDGVLAGSDPAASSKSYSGYWRVGGDSLAGWAGQPTSNYFAGSIDEVAVYDQVLTGGQVASHYNAGGGLPPNQQPHADFSVAKADLQATFTDASSDPDGTIVSRSWNFGDGGTSTDTNPVHTYAGAGTYTVQLIVTDNGGAQNTVTQSVTVAAHVNQTPTASFTTQVDRLAINVNGSGSGDSDGTIQSYAWSWGDGTADGSGATASHTYGPAGTYTVTLTVTDNEGATATKTQQVTVADLAAADTFQRNAAGGWGTADIGGPWTGTGVLSRLSVNGAAGVVTAAAGQGNFVYLNQVNEKDVTGLVDFSADKAATGSGYYMSAIARRNGTSAYNFRVRVLPDGVRLYVTRQVNGTEVTLGAVATVLPSYTPGDALRMRFEVTGTSTATLKATLWKVGTAEPGTPQVVRTDSAPELSGPGAVGAYGNVSGTVTNGPVQISFDNFEITPLD